MQRSRVFLDGGLYRAISAERAPFYEHLLSAGILEPHARVAGAIHGVPTVGLRFFNLYGPLSPYLGVISIFADRLLRGEPVEIFGDGEQARDFTFINDAVCALRRAMRAASTSAFVFNVCTGKATNVRSVAQTLVEVCGTELVVHRRPARCSQVRISIGDPERLGFTARTTLSEGLAITLNCLKRIAGSASVSQLEA